MKARKIISAILALALIICLLPQTIVTAAEVTGSFTVAAMSIDGLPASVAPNAPGSAGTEVIGTRAGQMGWDIVGVFEDFEYNAELVANLGTNYSSGSVSVNNNVDVNNADGLNLLWKNNVNVSSETITPWNATDDFENCTVEKGFRYYVAEVAPNVLVDVYVVNVDTESGLTSPFTRMNQLGQLSGAIKGNTSNRPIVVLGDMNAVYTHDMLKKYFVDAVNKDNRLSVQDVWVENTRQGSYPSYNLLGERLTPRDKGGTLDYPMAEVTEKIYIINNTASDITLSCNSYYVAMGFVSFNGGMAMEDWPVVAQITYSMTVPDHIHQYTEFLGHFDPTCTGQGAEGWQCECGEMQIEYFDPLGHDFGDEVTINATCTEDGSTSVTCNRCGYVSMSNVVPALGHDYQVTETVPVGCITQGEVVHTCSRCQDSYTEIIPYPGHNYQRKSETAGTCTTLGTAVYECSNCHDRFEITTSYAHNYQCVEVVEPTCVEDGTKTYACSLCGDTYSIYYAYPLGHSFNRGACERCDEPDPDFVPTNDPYYVLGDPATEIEDGGKYAIMFPSNKLYVLGRTSTTVSTQTLPNASVGDISKDIVWTINEVTGGYTISADVNGQTLYLARSSSINFGGYSLRLQTSPFVWRISMSSAPFARVSCTLGSSNFVLRYYSGARNWIASSKMSDICIYEVNEEF